VHECIRLSVVALDEAEAFHRVEELDRAAGLLAGQLPLRAALGAFDRHRLALNPEVCRRDTSAAIDERELERLTVRQIRQSRLFDGGNVDKDVFAAVIANDESETLLRVEEFDDSFAFADDLGGHSATTAAAAAETATATTTETATAVAATAAATIAEATAVAESAATATAITIAAATAAKAAAVLMTALVAKSAVAEEIVALVAAASAAIPLAPFIETHAPSEVSPPNPENQRARAKWRNRSWRESTHAPFSPLQEK
jgi:hypothetical protein